MLKIIIKTEFRIYSKSFDYFVQRVSQFQNLNSVLLQFQKMDTKKNAFLIKHKENADFNQYWFSHNTIEALVEEATKNGPKVAFLSTPSVYYNLKDTDVKSQSYVFDVYHNFS